MRLPFFVQIWFAVDLALAVLPPLHWAAGGVDLLFGMPRILVYLFGTSAFIAASVVTAYLCERASLSRGPN